MSHDDKENRARLLRWIDYQLAEIADPSPEALRDYSLQSICFSSGKIPEDLNEFLAVLARVGKSLASIRAELSRGAT